MYPPRAQSPSRNAPMYFQLRNTRKSVNVLEKIPIIGRGKSPLCGGAKKVSFVYKIPRALAVGIPHPTGWGSSIASFWLSSLYPFGVRMVIIPLFSVKGRPHISFSALSIWGAVVPASLGPIGRGAARFLFRVGYSGAGSGCGRRWWADRCRSSEWP